jgi:hypothetical protein
VPTCVATTVTSGSAASVASMTEPRIPPRNVCAPSVAAPSSQTTPVHRALKFLAFSTAGYDAADGTVKAGL